jgi:hypothetical protein
MLILLVLLLALILFGAGFAVHVLWIIAAIVFVLWILGFLVGAFARGVEDVTAGHRRRRWYGW